MTYALTITRWGRNKLPDIEGYRWETFADEPVLRHVAADHYVCWINAPETNKRAAGRAEWSVYTLADHELADGVHTFFDSLKECIAFVELSAQLGMFVVKKEST